LLVEKGELKKYNNALASTTINTLDCLEMAIKAIENILLDETLRATN
jgi:hypothetical protein